MEEYNKEGKILHATASKSIRNLVAKANKLLIPREDIVAALQEKDEYILLYYYLGVQ